VSELRVLFRYLQEFRSLYETEGIDEIISPSGREWSLWDLEYLFEQAPRLLTHSQYTAIKLFLVQDHREQDAAQLMGVSPTNPVGMYATLGLRKLVEFIETGGIARFRSHTDDWQHAHYHQAIGSMAALAGRIKTSTTRVMDGCLRYTLTAPGQEPRIRLRSRATASGFFYVHPLLVTYVAHRGMIPPGYTVCHQAMDEFDQACVNFEHGMLRRAGAGAGTIGRQR
jgi:hypothetical protein